MKLQVQYLKAGKAVSLEQLSEQLNGYPKIPLTNQSWPQIPTVCTADFIIAHTGRNILLKFIVTNDYFRTAERNINGEVHLDNCVEFFISFDHSGNYYNIEFNCLGIGKMAYGRKDGERKFIAEASVREIETFSRMNRQGKMFNWEMTWLIPAGVFTDHQIESFEGLHAAGNFYKCGDALPHPHFLSWNRINAPEPDFHRPDFFGKIGFVPQNVSSAEFGNLTK